MRAVRGYIHFPYATPALAGHVNLRRIDICLEGSEIPSRPTPDAVYASPSLHLLAIMDAPEADVDITLQKASADLISDFDRFLPTFLRKPEANGASRVRSRVRAREVHWATNTVRKPTTSH